MSRVGVAERALVEQSHPTLSVLRLLGRRPGRMSIALVAFAFKEVPLWFLPVITARVVDIVATGGSVEEVLTWFVVATILLAQNFPNHLLYTHNFMTVVRDTGVDLRNALTARLQEVSIGYHSRENAAVVQSKLVRDVENVELMLQQLTHPLLSSIMSLLGALTATAVLVPQFLPVYALTIPVALLLRTLTARGSRARNAVFRREMEGLASRAGEMAALVQVTRAHGLERTAIDRVADAADAVRRSGLALDMLNGRVASLSWVSMQWLGMGCLVVAASLSLTDVLPISPGEIVLLSTYFALLTGGVAGLLMLMPISARGLESVRSIGAVLEETDLEPNAGRHVVSVVSGALRFDAVGHHYPAASAPAIQEVSLDVRAGETVAFVGPSGSGKSTLLNLALGVVRPTSGRILLDGVDLQELDLRSVRRFMSVVPQESVLFEGTVRDNVAYGLPTADDSQVREALRGANALEFLDAIGGLDAWIDPRGASLSGGQRQRLAIARALVRDPRILLLDEPTSALDSESESLVTDALDRLFHDRTTLVVAHRLSTVRRADRIVVLESGCVVDVGQFEDLITRNARYARLFAAQGAPPVTRPLAGTKVRDSPDGA